MSCIKSIIYVFMSHAEMLMMLQFFCLSFLKSNIAQNCVKDVLSMTHLSNAMLYQRIYSYLVSSQKESHYIHVTCEGVDGDTVHFFLVKHCTNLCELLNSIYSYFFFFFLYICIPTVTHNDHIVFPDI
ncbi:hypothetical protein EGW08_022656 [Elysia chlorotica]|uniref:Uncharacterized protein n=1 Tax=Elysia chlorotica TaxID=188477 RepID=A0A3S1H040_ELYCH|nr:hypothetical protein EGW08_022656 [Elysia chlorotica]